MKKIPVLLAAISLCLLSCHSTEEKKEFLLVSSVADTSKQLPYHEIWVQHTDSLKIYNYPNKTSNSAKYYLSNINLDSIELVNGKTIEIFKTKDLFEDLYNVTNDDMQYLMVKTEKGDGIFKGEFLNYVEGNWFQTEVSKVKTPNSDFKITETVSFTANEVSFFWEYFLGNKSIHKEKETVKATYISFENQLFLIPSSKENPYPIYHIFKAKDGNLQLNYFTDFESKSKSYTISNKVNSEEYEEYSLCMDYFQRLYYYDDDIRVFNGNNFLKNYLSEGLPNIENNGFINIHFTVNCDGKVGRFGLEMMDFDYQPMVFNPDLITHIVTKFKALNRWENLEKETNWPSRDTKLYYILKIENQTITDIAP